MRAIDVRHMGREKVICVWLVDDVIVDPGPQSTEETLLEALGDLVPRALLLTHIHFDHAGATGSLLRRWPDLPVYVHERGAPHLVDPAKLVASAGRLYGGEAGLRRLWGEVVPVPEENLRHRLPGPRRPCPHCRCQPCPGPPVPAVAPLPLWPAGAPVPAAPADVPPTPANRRPVRRQRWSRPSQRRWAPPFPRCPRSPRHSHNRPGSPAERPRQARARGAR